MKKIFASIVLSLAIFLNGWYVVYAALATNIQAYYKFDSGALTTDSVAGTYTLTNVNSVGETASGLIGYGADFGSANTTKLFKRTDTLGISYNDNFSISWWTKIQTEPTGADDFFLLSIRTGSNPGTYHTLEYANNGTFKYLLMQGNTAPSYTVTLGTSSWHHWVYVHTNGGGAHARDLYLDGTLILSDDDFSGDYHTSTPAFSLGAQYYVLGTNGYTSAFFDEVGVWSRALTSTEVTTLYNAGAGCQYSFSSCEGGGGGALPASITSDMIMFE